MSDAEPAHFQIGRTRTIAVIENIQVHDEIGFTVVRCDSVRTASPFSANI